MLEDIKNHLIEKYNPDAMIIGGSRATGAATEHSDWDMMLFFEEDPGYSFKPEIYEGQSVDVLLHAFPETDEDIKKSGVNYLRDLQVVFGDEERLMRIKQHAQDMYDAGFHMTEQQWHNRHKYMTRLIGRMIDYADSPDVFQFRLADMYIRLVRYWFEIIDTSYELSARLAYPYIKERDQKYYEWLAALRDPDITPADKISLLFEVFVYLFNECCIHDPLATGEYTR